MAKTGRTAKAGVREITGVASGPPEQATFVLHQKQKAFVDSRAIYRGFLAGIASGKTMVGAYDLMRRSEPEKLYAVVGPTYKVLSDATFRAFKEVAEKLGLWNEDQYFKTDNRCILNNRAEVLFRSGDQPGNLRGPTLSGCWLDECSQMPEEVFNVMIGRLRQGGIQGWLSATYTPNGPEHWTARVFNDATNKNVELFHCSTKDNPFIEPEFYENLLLQYGKGPGGLLRAQQELEGLVVSVEGAEWGPECFGPEIWVDQFPSADDEVRAVMLDSSKGVGGKSGDYSVFAKVKWCNNLLWVEFDMDNTRNTEAMAATAIEIQRVFNPMWFGIEAEFGVHFLGQSLNDRAEAAKVMLPLVLVPTHGVPKEVRIRRLTPYIVQRKIRFLNTDQTKLGVGQLQTFPNGQHDDSCDALEGGLRIIAESFGCA